MSTGCERSCLDPQANDWENWGSQMDICGNSFNGDFDAHVVSANGIGKSDDINCTIGTTAGGCILVRAHTLETSPADSLAFPTGPFFLRRRWVMG